MNGIRDIVSVRWALPSRKVMWRSYIRACQEGGGHYQQPVTILARTVYCTSEFSRSFRLSSRLSMRPCPNLYLTNCLTYPTRTSTFIFSFTIYRSHSHHIHIGVAASAQMWVLTQAFVLYILTLIFSTSASPVSSSFSGITSTRSRTRFVAKISNLRPF